MTIDDAPTAVSEDAAQAFYTYLRPAVRAMARRMEDELRQNDHKENWKNTEAEVLLGLLRGEVEELAESLLEGTPEQIASEAGDVGNYALMIADVAGGLSGNGRVFGSGR